MKLKIRKCPQNIIQNIEGRELRREYTYTVAIRKWGIWRYLLFYQAKNKMPKERAWYLLNLKGEIGTSFCHGSRFATHFPNEDDAVSIMNDIRSTGGQLPLP